MPDAPDGRPLILLAKRIDPALPERIAADEHPRVDYLELARCLGAEIVDYRSVASSRDPVVAWIARRYGLPWGLAWLGVLGRSTCSWMYVTGEDIGLRVGPLLRLAGWRGRLTVVMHNARTPKRRRLLRLLGHALFRYVVCLGSEQRRVLVEEAGLPPEKVRQLPFWCDQRFYRPGPPTHGDYVLSVGMEGRDYASLQDAARGLEQPVHVVASGWSAGTGFTAARVEETINVSVGRGYTYRELRDLYARARFVVVPLKALSYAAGVNTIVEAMAMAKAVIVSASPGILDYVKDGVSGLVVPVGDAEALRRAILDLWHDPVRAAAMGQHNRRWIEETINIDRYVAQITELHAALLAPAAGPHEGARAAERRL